MKTIKLSQIADIVAGQSPESKFYTTNCADTPFLQGNRTFGDVYPVIDTYTSKITKIAPKGSILMSVRAPVGDLNIAKTDVCIGRGLVSINAKNGDNNSLFYILKYNIPFIIKKGNGTTYDSITIETLKDAEIIIPQKSETISDVLLSIDTQIQRNKDMCHKLQVLAQTTYGRWFNQFEFPNEDGLPYKSSGGKMIWNDELKREVPDGWSTILVGNATKCCLGGTPSRDKIEYWNGNINWINSGEVANFPIIETKEKITKSGLQYSATEIMPPKTAIISITGNIRFSINAIPCCANQSVVGVFETEKLPISYLYFALLENEQKYVKQMTGAIQKHINKDIIEKTIMLTPNNQVIQQYNNIVDTIIEQILILSKQTFELNNLKNCILPLLINGQLNI